MLSLSPTASRPLRSGAPPCLPLAEAPAELWSRLQLQGELQAKKDAPKMYRGVLHGVATIVRNEGPKGLFRGLSCAVSRRT